MVVVMFSLVQSVYTRVNQLRNSIKQLIMIDHDSIMNSVCDHLKSEWRSQVDSRDTTPSPRYPAGLTHSYKKTHPASMVYFPVTSLSGMNQDAFAFTL